MMDEHELINIEWDERKNDGDPCDPRNMTKDDLAAMEKAGWVGFTENAITHFCYEGAGRQILEHIEIANAWAMPMNEDEIKPTLTLEKYNDLKKDYADRIYKAVFAGKINGIIAWRTQKGINEIAEISAESLNSVRLEERFAQITGRDICLNIHIDRNDFSEWLLKEPDAKIGPDCLLNLWMENEYLEPKEQAKTDTESKGRNHQRLKITKEWYASIRSKFENNDELVNAKINRLKNDEIKNELKAITPKELRHIWENGADDWITRNGSKIRGFKKRQGRKPK